MNKEQVYCTKCKHLKTATTPDGEYLVACKYDEKCDLFDTEDSKPLSKRPYYERID